jgi:uncharacterized RDD family membrane protein YckC
MHPVPKYEYLILLLGDVAVFVLSLWITLALRYVAIPDTEILTLHAVPFALLFALWIVVFFLAGLYGKHTRLFRSSLPSLILKRESIKNSSPK